ncbi:hypothetical protein BDC45DRAFT_562267 [Circinella umbellata]|nr:hypothetical protein BDC45DRAFT_562267 [Circinella umbellata]
MSVQQFITSSIQYLDNRTDLWKVDIPESLALRRHIVHFQDIMDPIISDTKNNLNTILNSFVINECKDNKSSTAQETYVKDILRAIHAAQKGLEKYFNDKKSENTRLSQLLKRGADVKACRTTVLTQSNNILSGLNHLFQLEHIPLKYSRSSLDASKFEKDLVKEGYTFWKGANGNEIIGKWDRFISTYKTLYANFQPLDLDYTQKLLCANENSKVITIFGFIEITRKHGFPFESMVVHADNTNNGGATSEEARADIAKMVIPLVSEFSAPEMQAHLVAIYSWYNGIPRDDKQGYQERAKKWGLLIKEARQVATKDEEHLAAEKVDTARRAISFFYQRFMMIWRIGPISRDMLLLPVFQESHVSRIFYDV